jgi:plasmid maintenance system antidote protein VapI
MNFSYLQMARRILLNGWKLLDYYSLNASGFADKIGVQRSSLSHLLSGEINLAWILFLRFLMFS